MSSIHFLPIQLLKPHENNDPNRVQSIKDEIIKVGAILSPLWVEKDHFIVLNGHHRLQALTELGCYFAPSILLDYKSDQIEVKICPGASILSIDKKSIVDRALLGALYPPRSSFHILNFNPPNCSIPLTKLGMSIEIRDSVFKGFQKASASSSLAQG